MPADQTGTLTGKWAAGPIPIAVQSNVFTAAESNAIQAAVTTWNNFGKQSFGRALFDAGTNGLRQSGLPSSTASSCAGTGVVNGNTYTAPLTIYRVTASWSHSGTPIAVTSTCPTSGSTTSNGLKIFNNAMIELNFQDYFVSGKPVPDLQSIVLHELGHLAGLNHTCEANAKAGVPGCGTGGLPAEYRAASLYPTYSTSSGSFETRRSLNFNDQGRTNCLYGSGSK